MTSVKRDLLLTSDYVWARTLARLQGLADEEYWWEPVPSCWSVRRRDGHWVADNAVPAPEPPPFTTIAWRLDHLTSCYGDDRNGVWLAVDGGEHFPTEPAGDADAAIERLANAHDRWRVVLDGTTDATLAEPLGAVAGPFGQASRASFVLHMLDEFSHHGAEVGVLRDLFRSRT